MIARKDKVNDYITILQIKHHEEREILLFNGKKNNLLLQQNNHSRTYIKNINLFQNDSEMSY